MESATSTPTPTPTLTPRQEHARKQLVKTKRRIRALLNLASDQAARAAAPDQLARLTRAAAALDSDVL